MIGFLNFKFGLFEDRYLGFDKKRGLGGGVGVWRVSYRIRFCIGYWIWYFYEVGIEKFYLKEVRLGKVRDK